MYYTNFQSYHFIQTYNGHLIWHTENQIYISKATISGKISGFLNVRINTQVLIYQSKTYQKMSDWERLYFAV